MRAIKLILLGLMLVPVLAPTSVAASPHDMTAGRYKRILKSATRYAESYEREDFYASLTWSATYLTPAVLQARSQRLAHLYKDSVIPDDAWRTSDANCLSPKVCFYVAFYAYEDRFNDLAGSGSLWRVVLKTGNQVFAPSIIHKINTLTPLDGALFPMSNGWSTHYYIVFEPDHDLAAPFSLEVLGPTGHSELKWKR